MSIVELWMGLTNRTGPLTKILRELEEIERGLGRLLKGDTPWQQDVTARLQRIEDLVGDGGNAVTLDVIVGEPTEQP